MDKGIEALIADMRAAAEKATPGQWVYLPKNTSIEYDVGSDDHQGSITYMDSGDFTQKITDLNGAHVAAANPENVLKLIAALEQAQKSNEFLKGQLSEISNFNPDWDKLEASYESWREIAAELLVAKNRIAELEASPNGMMQLSNELAEMKRSGVKIPASELPTDERFWTAVNNILYQQDEPGYRSVTLGLTESKSLYRWLSEILPLRSGTVEGGE